MELIDSHKIFSGKQLRYRHRSGVLNCDMVFSIYLPPQAEHGPVPVLYWLSGLTCDDQNFVTKAGAQRYAAEHGIAIVAPDTSPRGEAVPDDAESAWDFGLAAGFYVDASEKPWSDHYQMYSYINDELPSLIQDAFAVVTNKAAISGHSMGGHGALISALKNPNRFVSVSAFAPICAPMQCAWGQKAFTGYLGGDQNKWQAYDATALLLMSEQAVPMRIDQGADDSFLLEQLKPEKIQSAAKQKNYPLDYRLHAGYDHSYYFIASFIGEHIAFHAKHLSR
ncbi:S-formylglutathione hydrolase [Marinagarivorans cellulosilyticus]|uniref:S-formylglutathione hydrolase n=1 Tax=Marinagarivorans cellulosilyticus TaxID=2721545 RepID=A0AAN2BJJ1_9GAMM|nr:S-formylglutathione hydrolase [Marinagarivorans cellulosilyticus]BCD97007.1 S-formylglutathione hydrolase [Marinagarivorans cellulosilyticus]